MTLLIALIVAAIIGAAAGVLGQLTTLRIDPMTVGLLAATGWVLGDALRERVAG